MKANIYFSSLILASLLAGCASCTSNRVSKDYRGQALKLKKIGIVIAQAEILNLPYMGFRSPNSEKSAQSKKLFESAVVNQFTRNGYSAVLLDSDDDLSALIQQYQNIRSNIHYERDIDSIPNLDSNIPVLTRAGVDAVAIIWAHGNSSTGVRKTMIFLSWLFLLPIPSGEYFGELALFNKSGRLIFYNSKTGRGYNLYIEEDVSRICSELIKDLEAITQ